MACSCLTKTGSDWVVTPASGEPFTKKTEAEAIAAARRTNGSYAKVG